jgi:putative redox protein
VANIITVHVNQTSPSTSEGIIRQHRVLIDRPVEKGGEDQGAMGGELLLVALGGCFMSTLLAAIRAREAAITDVRVELAGTLDGSPPRFTAIAMQVSGNYDDRDLMSKLVTIAERSCIVANTLREAVELTFTVK